MITADYHVHTDFSTDSSAPMEEMVRAALQHGLERLCFTDHMDYRFPKQYAHLAENALPFRFDMEKYLAEIAELREKYSTGSFTILQGVELGIKENCIEDCLALTERTPLDFVIASTHIVDEIDPYYPEYWEGKTEKQGMLRYYEATLDNVQSEADFDVYGHLDYIIRYTTENQKRRKQGRFPLNAPCALNEYGEIIEEILKTLLKNGRGIECNTSGLKYRLGYAHPHMEILKLYRELGGEILTIGSDAHEPAHLCFGFDGISDYLKKAGFRYYTVFENRKPIMLPL